MHPRAAEYNLWAVYYDFVHEGLPGEAEFYVMQAIEHGGEALELGCGTGRISIPMAMSGVNVVGLDVSHDMLCICQEKLAEVGDMTGSLHLVEGDMGAFALGRQFPFVAMPYRTFMHLLTPEEQIACLSCVHRHLAPGGVFVLNVWAARPTALVAAMGNTPHNGLMPVGQYPAGEGSIVHFHAAHYDEHAQLLEEEHVLRELDAKGKKVHSARMEMTRAWTTPREMLHLTARCGFSVRHLWGDFYESPFEQDSKEMVWMLERGA